MSLGVVQTQFLCPRYVSVYELRGIDLTREVNQSTSGSVVKVRQAKDYACSDPREPDELEGLISRDLLLLYEGKSFGRYDSLYRDTIGSKWDPVPTMALSIRHCRTNAGASELPISMRARYYRVCVRESVGNPVTSEWSSASTVLPPGVSALDTAMIETTPWLRRTHEALGLVAVFNTFAFDFLVRIRVRAHLAKVILQRLPTPPTPPVVVHASLRLVCLHARYADLWREQVGDVWHEEHQPFTWPVLPSVEERWEVRAAIDAVVADAYGLSREQYEHVLSTFSHRSYPKAPALCRARFDELTAIGLEAFTRKHDPYHDIPLNENLPQPVIDLPGQGSGVGGQDSGERPTNLLGEPLPVNLLGEVEYGSWKGRRRT